MRNLSADFGNVQAKLDETQKKLTAQLAKYASDEAKKAVERYVPDEIKESPLDDILDKATDSGKAEKIIDKGFGALRKLKK